MFRRKILDGFQFDNNLAITNQVRLKNLAKRISLKASGHGLRTIRGRW